MSLRHSFQAALVALSAFALSSCATIIGGTTQTLNFQSTPTGATVMIDGNTVGQTPLSLNMKKGQKGWITFKKEGFESFTLPLNTAIDGIFWGNIVLGGFLGSTTDSATGAAYRYTQDSFMATLTPEGANQLDSSAQTSNRQEAKQFIVLTYKLLKAELKGTQGEYTYSLLKMLDVPKDKHAASVKKLRALLVAYDSIPEFADKATDLLLDQAKGALSSPQGPQFNSEEYLGTVRMAVIKRWGEIPPKSTGECHLTWEIMRDGRIRSLEIVGSSGNEKLNTHAIYVVEEISPFAPLPASFKSKSLKVNLTLTKVKQSPSYLKNHQRSP